MDPITGIAWATAAIKGAAKVMDLAKQAQAEQRDLTPAELDEVKAIRKASVSNLDSAISSRRSSEDLPGGTQD